LSSKIQGPFMTRFPRRTPGQILSCFQLAFLPVLAKNITNHSQAAWGSERPQDAARLSINFAVQLLGFTKHSVGANENRRRMNSPVGGMLAGSLTGRKVCHRVTLGTPVTLFSLALDFWKCHNNFCSNGLGLKELSAKGVGWLALGTQLGCSTGGGKVKVSSPAGVESGRESLTDNDCQRYAHLVHENGDC
jgi:hypothetical protein